MTLLGLILYPIALLILVVGNSKDADAMALKLEFPIPEHCQQRHEKLDANVMDRRRWFLRTLFSSSSLVLTGHPYSATASGQNSAVYDFQFYMRNLLQGNNAQGNVPASKPPTPLAPPRTLSGPLIPLLLNKDCTVSCVPARELGKLISAPSLIISSNMQAYRAKATEVGYGTYHQWLMEDVSDEYFFELTCYALWRTAAALLPSATSREKFARNIGRTLYNEMKQASIISASSSTETSKLAIPNGSSCKLLKAVIPMLHSILGAFESSQFISSFRVARESYSSKDDPLFDDDDDQDYYINENSLNFLVSIYNPATLQSSLQITAEGSRFAPEFVACTIAAMLEDVAEATTVTYESYFMDPEYRPNPKDFFPNEQLFQFTFFRKSSSS